MLLLPVLLISHGRGGPPVERTDKAIATGDENYGSGGFPGGEFLIRTRTNLDQFDWLNQSSSINNRIDKIDKIDRQGGQTRQTRQTR